MNRKLNKKLLNLIALSSGIAATLAVGIGGIVYSLQEKSGDKPIDQNVLPDSVYIIKNNVLMGFTKEFLDNPTAYDMCDTMEIPARVTEIASYAFFDIPQSGDPGSRIPSFITKLTFAEGSHCSSIGEGAFTESGLTSVDFPSTLQSIGYGAFHNCLALTSVNLLNCTNLTKLDAFSGCKALTSVVLPNSLTEIGRYAFDSCSKLTSINFPSSLQSIGNDAFYYCSSLTSVDLSECINLNSISNMCFRRCSSLTSVSFPSSLQTIGENAFDDCSKLNSITWDAWNGSIALQSNTFSGVCPDGGTVTVINPIDDDHNSAALLDYLLDNGGLPESWRLEDRALPEEVYIIENNVLKGFTSAFLDNPTAYNTYNTIEIPANVTSIADSAFLKNHGTTIPSFIKKLTFAEGSVCSTIGIDAIRASKLTSVTLPSALITIQESAFEGCYKLTSVDFPSSLQSIGVYAFAGCSALTTIDFLKATNLSSIGGYAFYSCPQLISVDLSNCVNLSSIGEGGFFSCETLSSVTFPSGLKTIGAQVFINCPQVNHIVWDLPDDYETSITIVDALFANISSTGTVKSLNPSITSQQLLEFLQTKAGLPTTGWTAE